MSGWLGCDFWSYSYELFVVSVGGVVERGWLDVVMGNRCDGGGGGGFCER